jgi:hypothetical protein
MKRSTVIMLTLAGMFLIGLILFFWITDLFDSMSESSGPLTFEKPSESEPQRRERSEKTLGQLTDERDRPPWLRGKSIEMMIQEFGPPDLGSSYRAWISLDPFREPHVRKVYPRHSAVMIKELWWEYDPYVVSVWFHRKNGNWHEFTSERWRVAFRAPPKQ